MSATTHTGFAARPVGEIAAALPGATAVFRKHKLDFCCGGEAPLAEAAAARGASLPTLEAELAALVPDAAAAPQETDALIDLIETRYHATHRRELPELIRLARRVEAVHGDKAAAPRGLAELLQTMSAELEDHMQKEEQVLYLIDLTREKLGYPNLKRRVVELARMFNADSVIIEDKGSGISLIQDLRSGVEGAPYPIEFTPEGDKVTRMSTQSAKIEAGHVFLPLRAEWLDDFRTELLQFPHGRHDDQIDSVSQFLNWIDQRQRNRVWVTEFPF